MRSVLSAVLLSSPEVIEKCLFCQVRGQDPSAAVKLVQVLLERQSRMLKNEANADVPKTAVP